MKRTRSAMSLSRLIGVAITVVALVGSLVGGAAVAAAQERSDAPSTDSRTQASESTRSVDDNQANEGRNGTESESDAVRTDENDDVRTPTDDEDGQRDESDRMDGVIDVESILSSPNPDQSLADYAALYGINEGELVSLLMAEIDAKLAVAVENGELTQEQADEIQAQVEAHLTALINMDEGVAQEDVSFEQFLSLDVIANLVGINVGTLESALQRDMTFAEIAEQHGMTADEFVAALVAEVEQQITVAVENGELTQEQAEQILAELETKVTEFVGAITENGEDTGTDTTDTMEPTHGSLETIAGLTGTTVDDIVAAVQTGQTLADFAAEHGVDQDTLVNAIVVDIDAQLATTVENGVITQDDADMIRANAEEFVTSFVNTPDLEDVVSGESDHCEPIVPESMMPGAICPETN